MSVLYFDLDGTPIDVRRMHYAAYAHTARELGIAPLAEREYWDLRREGAAHADLIDEADAGRYELFAKKWRERMESPSCVRLDTLIPGARATLAALRESYELVLVTLREDRESLFAQLDELSLRKFFSAVYCHDAADEPSAKARFIRLASNEVGEGAVVCDSETDISVARELGSESLCVSNGVRTRRYLDDFAPDDVISSIVYLPDALPASPDSPSADERVP